MRRKEDEGKKGRKREAQKDLRSHKNGAKRMKAEKKNEMKEKK